MEAMIEQINRIITILNNEFFQEDYNGKYSGYSPYTYSSDGYTCIVKFMGIDIWNSEDDEREFYEDTNLYEPLEYYLRRETKKLLMYLVGNITFK